MQNPSDTNSLRDFAEWKEKCDIKGQAYCSLPNACPLTTRELPGNVKVSLLGVDSLWGDCTFIPADWGS